MSNEKFVELYRQGIIKEDEYYTYLLFECQDEGRRYLANRIESVLMEEPINPTKDLFAWHDGRRSVWRDLKIIIKNVDQKIKESLVNGNSN